MADADIVRLAESIRASIDSAEFCEDFTPKRVYLAQMELSGSGVEVWVQPLSSDSVFESRSKVVTDEYRIAIHVSGRVRVNDGELDLSDMDHYLLLSQQVKDHIRTAIDILPGESVGLTAIENNEAWSDAAIEQSHEYRTYIELIYRFIRS